VAANNAATGESKIPGAPEFSFSRVFNAPREQVFKAFTDLDALKRWWGPRGFDWVSATLDLRPGGMFHYCMRSPQGADMWGRFVYREIAPPERLVYVNSFSDESGGITPNPWMPDWAREVLNTVTFAEHEGNTTVTLHGTPINTDEVGRKLFEGAGESMRKGFGGTLDALDEYLATGHTRRAV
jgi:uncharacterized protein YndB with AHSA1/START domain